MAAAAAHRMKTPPETFAQTPDSKNKGDSASQASIMTAAAVNGIMSEDESDVDDDEALNHADSANTSLSSYNIMAAAAAAKIFDPVRTPKSSAANVEIRPTLTVAVSRGLDANPSERFEHWSSSEYLFVVCCCLTNADFCIGHSLGMTTKRESWRPKRLATKFRRRYSMAIQLQLSTGVP